MDQPFEELLSRWDRAAFEILCKRIEVLLLRNRLPNAVQALRQFNGLISLMPPTVDDHVIDVFPVRLANQLEADGFTNIGSVCSAKDKDLLSLPNFGMSALRQVDAVRTALRNNTPLPRVVDESFPDLKPEFEIDWDYLALLDRNENKMSETKQTYTTKIDQLLSLISGGADSLAGDIDAEINKHQSKISELNRLKKLIAGKSKSVSVRAKIDTDSESKIVEFLRTHPGNSARAKLIEGATGISYFMVGKIAKQSDRLNSVDGLVSLVA